MSDGFPRFPHIFPKNAFPEFFSRAYKIGGFYFFFLIPSSASVKRCQALASKLNIMKFIVKKWKSLIGENSGNVFLGKGPMWSSQIFTSPHFERNNWIAINNIDVHHTLILTRSWWKWQTYLILNQIFSLYIKVIHFIKWQIYLLVYYRLNLTLNSHLKR